MNKAIVENRSAKLDELDLIQKRKHQETTYEKYSCLLWNLFNVTCVHITTLRTQMSTSWGWAIYFVLSYILKSLLFSEFDSLIHCHKLKPMNHLLPLTPRKEWM